MGDRLQDVLAEIARGIGIETGQLWEWMQGDGLRAYATVEVLTNLSLFVICVIVVVLSAWWFHRANADGRKLFDEYGDGFIFDVIFLVLGVIFAIVGASVMPDTLGWLVSPEGMVLHMAARAVGA